MWPISNSRSKALVTCIALALASTAVSAKTTGANAQGESQGTESFSPPLENEIVVSDRDFNHFVFPAAIVNGPIFPAGSPVLGNPVYLANNTQLLLQLESGASKPFNMIVELENGSVYKFWLRPRPIAGITKRVDGASEKRGVRSSASAPRGTGARAEDVELMKRLVSGQLPEDFEPVALPAPTRFDKFSVIPLSGWSDGFSRRVTVYSLVAAPGQTAVVAPPQFYRPGITAISIDGDVVDVTNAPTLYVIEEVSADE
mgnify:CR=1 FL=1